jgi:N-acetylmuramoyl-L-alanine amidase
MQSSFTLRMAGWAGLFLLLHSLMAEPSTPQLSLLGTAPDWSRLDAYQYTVEETAFREALDRLYAPREAWEGLITFHEDHAAIMTAPHSAPYRLYWKTGGRRQAPPPSPWTSGEVLRQRLAANPPDQPLRGLHVALDPGHIGGDYAIMEERHFAIGDDAPVREGDLTLEVARRLRDCLVALGAQVSLLRDAPLPVTTATPESLRPDALAWAQRRREAAGLSGPAPAEEVDALADLLFYRVAEIRARADLVGQHSPDIVLCLHFNAAPWPDSDRQTLVDERHAHILVNGSYSAGELALDDVRLVMLERLLAGLHDEEKPLAAALAASMAEATGLPPFVYDGPPAVAIDGEPYVYGRNLLANRLFPAPVIFLEPYIMNDHIHYARIQAGDYDGLRDHGEGPRPSIYHEYVAWVVDGLLRYYRKD